MNRGVAIFLVFLVLAAALLAGGISSRGGRYFDPHLSRGSYPCTLHPDPGKRGPLDWDIDGWIAEPLRKVGEPSLYFEKPAGNTTTLRFTFLPSFTDPVIVRIDDLYGDHPRLTATREKDQVVVREGPDHLVRDLSKAELEPLLAFLESTRVLNLPPDSCLSGIDGVIFLIEANGPDGYRFINRWGVSQGPVYDLGNLMFQLTGWPNGEQGPDRNREGYRSGTGPDGKPWPRPDLTPAPEI
ncbi:hypothetical protein [Brevundimonas sp.]|uniref:hypothetical protein n=1 Tax=Brevundimonas sp. TaxID=1871086 RepID=UPI002FCB4446